MVRLSDYDIRYLLREANWNHIPIIYQIQIINREKKTILA